MHAPSYLTDACCLVTDGRPTIKHSDYICMLLVSRTRTNFGGDRASSAAGPKVWNYLPTDLRQPDLSYVFWQRGQNAVWTPVPLTAL